MKLEYRSAVTLEQENLKNKRGTRAREARVLLSHLSLLPPHLNHLLPTIPNQEQSKTYPETKPLNLAISLSQSRYLPLNLKLFPHKYSHSASQSRKYSHSPSQSRDLLHSPSPSRSRSPSHKVCLAQLACLACGYFCLYFYGYFYGYFKQKGIIHF